MSVSDTPDRGDGREGGKTAPSDRRAGWIIYAAIGVLFSLVVLITDAGDDAPTTSDYRGSMSEQVPFVLRTVVNLIGSLQHRNK